MSLKAIEPTQRIKQQDATIRAYIKRVEKLEAELFELRARLSATISNLTPLSLVSAAQTLIRGSHAE